PESSVTIASTCTSVVPPRNTGGCCTGAACCARTRTPAATSRRSANETLIGGDGARRLQPSGGRSPERFALQPAVAMLPSALERDVTTQHTEAARHPLTMLSEDERLFRDSVYEFAHREVRPL